MPCLCFVCNLTKLRVLIYWRWKNNKLTRALFVRGVSGTSYKGWAIILFPSEKNKLNVLMRVVRHAVEKLLLLYFGMWLNLISYLISTFKWGINWEFLTILLLLVIRFLFFRCLKFIIEVLHPKRKVPTTSL